MFVTAFSALSSHWRRKPLQLATLLVGLALATALWSSVKAINAEAEASYGEAAAVLGQDQLSVLARQDDDPMDQQVFIDLTRAGWLVSPVLDGTVQFGSVKLHLIGIDPVTMPLQGSGAAVPQGDDLLPFITEPGLMYVNAETAERLASQNTPPLRVGSGIPPGTVITDIGQAQTLLKAGNRISRLLVAKVQPMNRLPLGRAAPDLTLRQPAQSTDLARLTDSFHLNLTAFGYLAYAVGIFIAYAAIGLAFEQRRATFHTLRALGLPVRALIFILVAELLCMALVAGLLGVALGYLIAALLLPDVAASLRGLYGVDVSGMLTLRSNWWLQGIAIAVVGTLVSAAQNLWAVAHLSILVPAQPEARATAAMRTRNWQGRIAAVVLLVAAALAKFGSGLFAGFALLGTMLLGACLLLPLLLAGLLKLAAHFATGSLAQWFWADTRQQLSGQSMALMALLLALTTNVGVGTMVSSFRLTFTGYLDQRLASELYVTAQSESVADAMRAWVAPRAKAVLPIWSIEGKVGGQPAQVYGVLDHATYRDNWPMLSALPQAWDRIAAGDGALVNEQLSRRQHLSLGNAITLPGSLHYQVVGIYSDYGNPVGQVIISLAQLTAHYPQAQHLRFAVRVEPERAQDLADALREQFALPELNVINQADLKRFSMQVFEHTFSVTAALNVLTLGVAVIAMFASLLSLSEMRLRQLAPVWAMGLTRRRLALLEFGRSLLLASFTMIAALPTGLALAWVLLSVVNVEAFGWRLPMHVFPMQWLWLSGLGLCATALAAAIPVRRLGASSPSVLLRAFANER